VKPLLMRNIRLILSYDGSDFSGWQAQPGFRTVQETLETAVAALGGSPVRANASGRTDAGVHAVGQVVNFYTDLTIPTDKFAKAVNAYLPPDVVVRSAEDAPQSFDANRDAQCKLYRYVIHDGAVPDVFMRRHCCHTRRRLDATAMARASAPLLGRHDFHSFETEWPNRMSSVRTITHLAVNRMGDWIWLDVEADGFLYNMVRAIAGTLINVGRGYWPESEVAEILRAEDRRRAGPTAPAQGLFLMRVTYER
jgi:tRNA pseudouridine38-40 synthase